MADETAEQVEDTSGGAAGKAWRAQKRRAQLAHAAAEMGVDVSTLGNESEWRIGGDGLLVSLTRVDETGGPLRLWSLVRPEAVPKVVIRKVRGAIHPADQAAYEQARAAILAGRPQVILFENA